MRRITINLFFSLTLFFFPILGTAAFDTITVTNPLQFHETIASAGQVFELGFFNPGESSNWYVGIWYKRIPQSQRTCVWVANRDNPLINTPGTLKISEDGDLFLVDQAGFTFWSLNETKAANSVAQLLDSGNFVVRRDNDSNPENYLWQSFDHPSDTMLPGMKLGWDAKSGLNRFLTSWNTKDDPSSGDYTFKLETKGFPEILLRDKQVTKYRSGAWNGLRFSGVPEMKSSPAFSFQFVTEKDKAVYYTFQLHNQSLYSRLLVNPNGDLQRYTWIDSIKVWNLFWFAPKDQCDDFLECGPFGVCDTNSSPVCKCMPGFKPRNPTAWNLRDGSGGCVRKTKLDCKEDGFSQCRNMKVPESTGAFVDKWMNISACRNMCQQDCSCTAYANSNIIDGGSGCVIWTFDLLDMRQYAVVEGGQDLYVRLAASDLDTGNLGSESDSRKRNETIKVAGISFASVIVLFGLGICILWKRKTLQSAIWNKMERKGPIVRSQNILFNEVVIPSKRKYSSESTTDELELPLFDFGTIVMATDNFSEANKLGQGGFGCVYKGMLLDGQEIAVKMLSKNSGQGIEEFKNEVRLIARLQHRNLVQLLGYCIEMEEKMLIYEYMENKSLDCILFNKEKGSLLNWQCRFNIICGIARGLLYLHQDSRFRIIHRDLKASNILLDKETKPKISDFGMARIFGGDQTEASTRRVVGTYGYMAPEYAMDGLFSVKSDAFSFGVLLLEIITGIKNRGFYYTNNQLNLLGHAWMLWKEGRGLELMDPLAGDSFSSNEVMRCIQVGLLCVQEKAEDRPNMSTVVLMLSSETAPSAQPKTPGFCLERKPVEAESSSCKQDESCTVNHLTVTIIDGR